MLALAAFAMRSALWARSCCSGCRSFVAMNRNRGESGNARTHLASARPCVAINGRSPVSNETALLVRSSVDQRIFMMWSPISPRLIKRARNSLPMLSRNRGCSFSSHSYPFGGSVSFLSARYCGSARSSFLSRFRARVPRRANADHEGAWPLESASTPPASLPSY